MSGRWAHAVVAAMRRVPVAFASTTGVAAVWFAAAGRADGALLFGLAAGLAVTVAVRVGLLARE